MLNTTTTYVTKCCNKKVVSTPIIVIHSPDGYNLRLPLYQLTNFGKNSSLELVGCAHLRWCCCAQQQQCCQRLDHHFTFTGYYL